MINLGCLVLAVVASTQVRVSFEQKTLADAPEEVTITKVAFAKTGKHVIYVARRGTGYIVGTNNKVDGIYDAVTRGPLINDNGKLAGFVGKKGKTFMTVINGKVVGTGAGVTSLAFSPDGRKWVYTHSTAESAYANVNGRHSQNYAMVGQAVFAPKGSLLAYQVNTLAGTDGITNQTAFRHRMVIGGRGEQHFERVGGDPVFSPDGKKAAYRAQNHSVWYVVLRGQKSRGWEEVDHLIWSPDSRHLMYRAHDGRQNKYYIVEDGVKSPPYDTVGPPQYHPKSKVKVYAVKHDGRAYISIDGREIIGEGYKWDTVADPTYSKNGEILSYRAMSKGKWRMITADVASAEFEYVGKPYLSADGSTVAYKAAYKQYQFIVVNDKPQTRYFKVEDPVIGPKGRVAYAAVRRTGDWSLVCGRTVSEPCDKIYTKPVFNKSGTKVACGIKRGQELIWLVLDLPLDDVPYARRGSTVAERRLNGSDKRR